MSSKVNILISYELIFKNSLKNNLLKIITILNFCFLLGIEETPRGNETRMLYAGPLDNSKAVFGVGRFHLVAEIHEEAGAYTNFDIDTNFVTVLPLREAYEAYGFDAEVKKYKDTGDSARTAMLLQVQYSFHNYQKFSACTYCTIYFKTLTLKINRCRSLPNCFIQLSR